MTAPTATELRERIATYDAQLDALERRLFALGKRRSLEDERERRRLYTLRAGAQHELTALEASA